MNSLVNIIDHRHRPYRWKTIHAVIEATYHDNAADDADEVPCPDIPVMYDRRKAIAVSEAIEWAGAQSCPVTLYLYDEGAEI